jgi:glycerate 2-kinase
VRVLVAPDKFKGTLSAAEAAAAIARGWRRASPGAEITSVPLADGGEGTLDALVGGPGGERRSVTVTGPVGSQVDAEFGLVPGPGGPVGVIEMARASGLALVPPERRDPTRTTTRGTGELMRAAVRSGARRLIVCVGGSGTNDAGAGLAHAVGVLLLDAAGREITEGGAALLDLEEIDVTGLAPELRGVPVEVLVDVDNPLVGPDGASAIFGPQKGATPDDVALLDRALTRFASVILRATGVDVASMPGAGAAGGIGASLAAFLQATLRPGVDAVMDATGVRVRIAAADVAVTGEGTFDAESLRGKVVGGVIREAARGAGRRIVILCGRRAALAPPGAEMAALTDRFGPDRAMVEAGALLEELAAETAAAPVVRAPR